METLLKSRLAVTTGWGTGGAVLFAWFGNNLKAGLPWLAIVDMALATCTVTFFVLMVMAAAKAPTDSDTSNLHHHESGKWRPLLGLLFSLLFLIAGWSLLLQVSSEPGTTRTATTLGALLSGGGLLVTYKWIAKLMNKEWS